MKTESGYPTTFAALEARARLHVDEKYIGGFWRRHEDFWFVTAIVGVSLLVGFWLRDEFSAAEISTAFNWSLAAVGLAAAAWGIYLFVAVSAKEARKAIGASLAKKVQIAIVCVVGISVYLLILYAIGAFMLAWADALRSGTSSGERKLYLLAATIGLPLTLILASLRKWLAADGILPPELIKTGYFARRRLRTSQGAVQRYLLDYLFQTEQKSLESVDELTGRATLGKKRVDEFLNEFRISVQEGRESGLCEPGYHKEPLARIKRLEESYREKLEQIKMVRFRITDYFAECRKWIGGLDKTYRDRSLMSRYWSFDHKSGSSADVEKFVAQTSYDMLNDTSSQERLLVSLKVEASKAAATEKLSHANIKELEALEAVLAKCAQFPVVKF